MDDEMLALTNRSDAEVVRRLEAFADLRLSPSLAARARMRSAVIDAAEQRADAMAAEAAATASMVPVVALDRSRRPVWRRPMVAFAAAALTVAMVTGSAMASTPGGPLYGARLWAEMANLPATGTARAQAEVQRLGQRLEEIQWASTAGDEPATEAALTAYSSILAEATAGSAGDPAAEATLKDAVTRHVLVLTALADEAPAPAKAALDRALAASAIVLDNLSRGDDGTSGDGGNGGAGNGGASNGGTSGDGGTGGGGVPGGGGGVPGGDNGGANSGDGNNGNGGSGTGANPGATDDPGRGGEPATTPQPDKGKPSDTPGKPPATPKPANTDHPGNGHHVPPTDGPGGSGEQGTTP